MPADVVLVTFAGQVIVGACVSLTVTVKVHGDDILPEASVAVQLTVVVPTGNVDPDAGVHTTVAPGQLSSDVAVKLTTAEHCPAVLFVTILAGQIAEGGMSSVTVTVKLQLGPTDAMQVTVVVPTGNVDPEAGLQMTVPQSPVVVGGG